MGKNSDRASEKGGAEKMTLREALRIHYRVSREVRKCCPGIFLCTALHAGVSALSPYVTIYLSARIINELAGQGRREVLEKLVLAALLGAAALNLITGLLLRLKEYRKSKCNVSLENLYAQKMLSMDFVDVEGTKSHELRSQIEQNSRWGGWGFRVVIPCFAGFVEGSIGVLGAVALTVSLFTLPVPESAGAFTVLNHPVFLLALLLVLALVIWLAPVCINRATSYWSRHAEDGKFGNRIFSTFAGFFTRYAKADQRMYNQQVIARYYLESGTGFGTKDVLAACARGPMGAWRALGEGISAVLTGAVYVFVCLKAWTGAFGVGSVTQYVGAVTALARNISRLLRTAGNLKTNAPFMSPVFEFLDIPNTMYQGSLSTEKRADREYEVEFRDVSFRYPGMEAWALRHVNMKFKIGRKMAVVGENGSGKTTFIKLLCRLYDPQEGEILLNGINIRKYDYRDYMDVFAVVFQDFQLIAQPLGANVAGSAQYDRDRVQKALTDAGFGERLGTMPQGLDTMLYKDFLKDGVEVSGGEAQKIAIARALYRDAPFIILDEPTAALDPVTEAEIYSKFNDIVGDKTAIYISHRLSSCKFCDEITVFHQGQVIQQGSHEELLAEERGKYHELWQAQAQYYAG